MWWIVGFAVVMGSTSLVIAQGDPLSPVSAALGHLSLCFAGCMTTPDTYSWTEYTYLQLADLHYHVLSVSSCSVRDASVT